MRHVRECIWCGRRMLKQRKGNVLFCPESSNWKCRDALRRAMNKTPEVWDKFGTKQKCQSCKKTFYSVFPRVACTKECKRDHKDMVMFAGKYDRSKCMRKEGQCTEYSTCSMKQFEKGKDWLCADGSDNYISPSWNYDKRPSIHGVVAGGKI